MVHTIHLTMLQAQSVVYKMALLLLSILAQPINVLRGSTIATQKINVFLDELLVVEIMQLLYSEKIMSHRLVQLIALGHFLEVSVRSSGRYG